MPPTATLCAVALISGLGDALPRRGWLQPELVPGPSPALKDWGGNEVQRRGASPSPALEPALDVLGIVPMIASEAVAEHRPSPTLVLGSAPNETEYEASVDAAEVGRKVKADTRNRPKVSYVHVAELLDDICVGGGEERHALSDLSLTPADMYKEERVCGLTAKGAAPSGYCKFALSSFCAHSIDGMARLVLSCAWL